MLAGKNLEGRQVILRQIEEGDCTPAYIKWLNDPEVNQYLETRWVGQDEGSIKEFIRSQRSNAHSILFAICLAEGMGHIGNIKIGPINKHHGYGAISYFIGEKSLWGKGIASEAVGLVCNFAFTELGLRRVEAGAYASAVGSWKALEHNGFVREGVFRKQVYSNGIYMDVYSYGLLEGELTI